MGEREGFELELTSLIHKYSLDDYYSDTPDFLLAEYILRSLQCWNETTKKRDAWYGFNKKISVYPGTTIPRRIDENLIHCLICGRDRDVCECKPLSIPGRGF